MRLENLISRIFYHGIALKFLIEPNYILASILRFWTQIILNIHAPLMDTSLYRNNTLEKLCFTQ